MIGIIEARETAQNYDDTITKRGILDLGWESGHVGRESESIAWDRDGSGMDMSRSHIGHEHRIWVWRYGIPTSWFCSLGVVDVQMCAVGYHPL
jgi:hypothetical protein